MGNMIGTFNVDVNWFSLIDLFIDSDFDGPRGVGHGPPKPEERQHRHSDGQPVGDLEAVMIKDQFRLRPPIDNSILVV